MSCIIFTAFVIISSTIIISFSTTNNAIITMNIKITTRNSTTTITNFTTSSIADTNIFIFCATITTTSTTISISYKTSEFELTFHTLQMHFWLSEEKVIKWNCKIYKVNLQSRFFACGAGTLVALRKLLWSKYCTIIEILPLHHHLL